MVQESNGHVTTTATVNWKEELDREAATMRAVIARLASSLINDAVARAEELLRQAEARAEAIVRLAEARAHGQVRDVIGEAIAAIDDTGNAVQRSINHGRRQRLEASRPKSGGPPVDGRLWTLRDVARRVNVNTRTVERWVSDGTLPKPIRVGNRCNRWRPEDIEAALKKMSEGQ